MVLLSHLLKGRGRYFLGVAELSSASERAEIKPDEKYRITASKLRNITTDYSLRIITDTAFYLNVQHEEWQSDGLRVSGGGASSGILEILQRQLAMKSSFLMSAIRQNYSEYFSHQNGYKTVPW